MQLSYWEYKTWLSNIDFMIVGAGIVGLNTALQLRKRYPSAKIVILEKGVLPQGASTKNAGFACFGSISEMLSDLKHHTEQEVVQLVKQRWEGIQLLRTLLGDDQIDFQSYGGHEVFMTDGSELFDICSENVDNINALLTPIFGENAFTVRPNTFGFTKVIDHYITHAFEGQIDTGKMMRRLIEKVQKSGVIILNSINVEEFSETNGNVVIKTNSFECTTQKLLIATNGFASELIDEEVKPARAQVLITQPISNLLIKGTFHLDEGFYYFRNIDDRILIGGGRNLDFKGESTPEFGHTDLIQKQLEHLLREMILPNIPFEIDTRWSGIMGVGKQKRPIVKRLSNRVFCGVRLGGMGVAIGSTVGKELADLV